MEFKDYLTMKNQKNMTQQEIEEQRLAEIKKRKLAMQQDIQRDRPVVRKPVQENVQRPIPQRQPVRIVEKKIIPQPLSEAYEMIDEMKEKMEDIFYQYGMSGLEKLNENLEDIIDEIMNPRPVYIEKEVPQTPVQPKKKTVKRRPRPRPTKVVEEHIEESIEEPIEEVPVKKTEGSVVQFEVEDTPVVDDRIIKFEEEQIEEIQEDTTVDELAKVQASMDMNDLSAILSSAEKKTHKTKTQLNTKKMIDKYENAISENVKEDTEEEIDISEEQVEEVTEEMEE